MTRQSTPSHRMWRSALFLPAHRQKFIDRAHERGADAYILDLEDSVPIPEKPSARADLANKAAAVSKNGAGALVRINHEKTQSAVDLEAAICPEVNAIIFPKANCAEDVQYIDSLIEDLERAKNMPIGATRLIAQIEDVAALPRLDEISRSSPRLTALHLGTEDFSLTADMSATTDMLFRPCQDLVFACRRNGIEPLGFPGSIAAYSDLDAFRSIIRMARRMGFAGALCIHPSQVSIMNEEFTPSRREVEDAQEIVKAYETGVAEGRGAVAQRGTMIDLPVVERAKRLLDAYGKYYGVGKE